MALVVLGIGSGHGLDINLTGLEVGPGHVGLVHGGVGLREHGGGADAALVHWVGVGAHIVVGQLTAGEEGRAVVQTHA